MKINRLGLVPVLALVGVAFVLGGCGKKEPAAEAESAAKQAESTAAESAAKGAAGGMQRLAFSGGPEGGTFQYFSNGIAIQLSKALDNVEVSNMASAGSLENLRRVNSGEADFGIVYSGDTYLGREGRLTNDTRKYENVHAMAYLYGAPAHLIVKADSGIDKVADLEGKRVAVGGAGSGALPARQAPRSAISRRSACGTR